MAHRLPAEERRKAIMRAARDVFLEKGCDAATTRELADAAGVSEALIYRHFPSKESLYEAICDDCSATPAAREFMRLLEQRPSTGTLIAMVTWFVREVLDPNSPATIGLRLFLRSLIEDNVYARQFVKRKLDAGLPQHFAACLQAARDAGDARDNGIQPEMAYWFMSQFCMALQALSVTEHSPMRIRGKKSLAVLVEQATAFVLSGFSVHHEVLRRYLK